MKISIFTPCHNYNSLYFREIIESLNQQDFRDFEWIVLLNGEVAQYAKEIEEDIRFYYKFSGGNSLIVESYKHTSNNVGLLKSEACNLSSGDILLELDHDDFLPPSALSNIHYEFMRDDKIQFVYSNCCEFVGKKDSLVCLKPYSDIYGWKYKNEGLYTQMVSFPPRAQYLRSLLWSPNHLRSFRKSAYEKIGGYPIHLQVGDDYDLMCRFYLQYGERGFKHINKLLYFYRKHEKQTWSNPEMNKIIQENVRIAYKRYSELMYIRWTNDNNLLCIDLGGRFGSEQINESYVTVDMVPGTADRIMDLRDTWKFSDDSVGVIRAYHILEHLPDTIHFFNEAFRVLAPGGFLLIEVPTVAGSGAFSDPTHVKFFNERSFEYYTNKDLARFIQPQYKGKFQKIHFEQNTWAGTDVTVASVQMICMKGDYEKNWCGENKWL